MFDFVTVIGSITDILCTEINVRVTHRMHPWVTSYMGTKIQCMLIAVGSQRQSSKAACCDTGSRFSPIRETVITIMD